MATTTRAASAFLPSLATRKRANFKAFCSPATQRRPAKCSLRQLRCCGDRRLASKLEMIQKNRAGRHYYFYYYYYKRTGWEAGGGTNTKTLSRGAQLVVNCTKKTTISHTDRPHKSDIVQLDLHNRACQCSKIQQRKKEACKTSED